jgi:hypothetical protein
MHCKVCAWSERDHHNVSNHDRKTCNHQGGDMEGYSRNQCIARQRQTNGAYYYQEEKYNRRPPPRTSPPSTAVKRLKAAPTDEVVEEQAYESNAKLLRSSVISRGK